MSDREPAFASAGRYDELRPLTPSEVDQKQEDDRARREWVAAGFMDEAPLSRLLVVDGQVLDGIEHGMAGEATICGMPQAAVFLMRHHFRADGTFACPTCAEKV
ncbi:hypothetical protein ACFQ46_02310 [Kineococcus sp. GCM10028916]|uniref:hypothetical protein n=1 Tax=Kineococcus sp. GCM10028916 TaxID=3273394 RepID=UPI00362F6E07